MVGNSLIGTCLTLPNLGFLWVFFKYLKISKNGHPLFFPVGSTTRSHTCQHHEEFTQSHTFAALIRLSTATHNLLTFNISEISSNSSEKLSLLPDNTFGLFSYSRLIQVPGCRVTRSADHLSLVFTPEKNDVFAWVKVHLQFCSHLIHLTPKSLSRRPKT